MRSHKKCNIYVFTFTLCIYIQPDDGPVHPVILHNKYIVVFDGVKGLIKSLYTTGRSLANGQNVFSARVLMNSSTWLNTTRSNCIPSGKEQIQIFESNPTILPSSH